MCEFARGSSKWARDNRATIRLHWRYSRWASSAEACDAKNRESDRRNPLPIHMDAPDCFTRWGFFAQFNCQYRDVVHDAEWCRPRRGWQGHEDLATNPELWPFATPHPLRQILLLKLTEGPPIHLRGFIKSVVTTRAYRYLNDD